MKIIYPFTIDIDVQVLSKKQLKKIVKTGNGKVDIEKNIKSAARSYMFEDGKIVVEFYDQQGILAANFNDFTKLKYVNFIKNQVYYIPSRISYYFKLDVTEAARLMSELEAEFLSEYKPSYEYEDFLLFKVFLLANKQAIISYETGEFYLYQDLEALKFHNYPILNDFSKESWLPKQKFIEGADPTVYNITSYELSQDDIAKVIKNNYLTLKEENIDFNHRYLSSLYKSPKGYYVLIPCSKTSKNNETVYIFRELNDFKIKYKNILYSRSQSNEKIYSKHIFETLSNKYGKDFPKCTFKEISKLPKLLNFEASKLGFTYECVCLLEESIKWNWGRDNFADEIFYPILAYIGEYNKKNGNGNWEMKSIQPDFWSTELWEPMFVDSKGYPIFKISDIYEDFYEPEHGMPILVIYIKTNGA